MTKAGIDNGSAVVSTPRNALTLAGVLLGFLVVPMAMSGTSTAIPAVAAELGGGGAALQWVVTGYFLAATCLMLVAGSLGDLYGRRLVFRVGVAVYALSTLGAGLAGSILLLDLARTLSGVGAAGVLACGGAILASTFDGAARNRAFGTVGTVVGIGLAFGPSAAGWLVTVLGWRGMFWTFGAAGLVVLLGSLVMRESRAERGPRVDVRGTLAFVAGMVGLMYGTNQVAQAGWTAPVVLGCIGAGVLMLGVFVVLERRTDHPVLDMGGRQPAEPAGWVSGALLRNRPFVGWLLAALAPAVGTVGVLVYLPTYLQGAGGLTPQAAGAVMLALTAPVLVIPPLAGRLVNAGVPARVLAVAAIGCLVAGNAWLTVLAPDAGVAALLGPLLVTGIGNGAAIGMIDAQAMSLVGPDRVGMASGLLNTVRAAANTLVLTVFGAVLVTVVQAGVGDRALAGRVALGDLSGGDRAMDPAALAALYTSAWHVALWAVAALCALLGLLVLRLTRPVAAGARTGTSAPRP